MIDRGVLRLAMAALAAACFWSAVPIAAQTDEEVAEEARRECRNGRGDLAYCVDHARDLFTGTGLAEDHAAALRLWRLVCDRDKTNVGAQACSNVNIVLRTSDTVPQDLPKAYEYAERACNLGSPIGCINLGYAYRDGNGITADGKLAAEAFDKACGYRNGEACQIAAEMYRDGKLVEADQERAVSLYRQGCALNDMLACASLAYQAERGLGMAEDWTLAIKEYKRSCAGGIDVSCRNIETIRGNAGSGYAELLAYEVVERAFPPELPIEQRYLLARAAFDAGNLELAMTGFQTLADEGFGEAAFNLGRIYYDGQGVAMDRPRAVRYFEQAADLRHPYAMYVLGEFNWYGINMNWNPDWGIAMMRGAAEAGLAEADPIWRQWQAERNAYFEARDAASREMALENERSAAAADAANMGRIWGLYSNSQNRQENGQVCGTIYRNNQANYECMARETFDKYYNPNR
jgi:TPR repeat protein